MRRVHTLDHLTLIATKTTRAAERTDWISWLRPLVHVHGGSLWRLSDPAPAGRPGAGHSHVLALDSSADDFDQAVAAARDDADTGHAEIRRDAWQRVGTPITVATQEPVSAMIVAEVLCADPRREAEWDSWYDEQHLPDMMASDAFVAGSRWRRDPPRAGTANHLTVYEVAGLSIDEAIERSAAVMPDIVAAGRKHESHTGALTWALELE